MGLLRKFAVIGRPGITIIAGKKLDAINLFWERGVSVTATQIKEVPNTWGVKTHRQNRKPKRKTR